jgi:hypothetical protein
VVDTGVIEDKPTRTWSMPKVTWTREQTDELARAATTAGTSIATFLRRAGTIGRRTATFGWRLIRQVPPVLQLLGALGLCALLSIAGSVALDNGLGKTCAVVFVPGFALAFGVAAHHWYLSLDTELPDSTADAPPKLDPQRSIEYVDSKLAFALNALGTDRHQQAVIALIQAKTATELSFGAGQEPVRQSQRPRIRAGGPTKASTRESVSIAGLA